MPTINNSPFKRLIGRWKTSGKIQSENGIINLSGEDNYEFILDGNYILHKANVMMGDEKSETLEIIVLENPAKPARMHYFNSKGESGIMTAQINKNEFLIDGAGLKFIGMINDGSTSVEGKWLSQSEDKNWHEFIILKLEKKN